MCWLGDVLPKGGAPGPVSTPRNHTSLTVGEGALHSLWQGCDSLTWHSQGRVYELYRNRQWGDKIEKRFYSKILGWNKHEFEAFLPRVKHRGRCLKQLQALSQRPQARCREQRLEGESMTPGGKLGPNSQDPIQTCPHEREPMVLSRCVAGNSNSPWALVS